MSEKHRRKVKAAVDTCDLMLMANENSSDGMPCNDGSLGDRPVKYCMLQ